MALFSVEHVKISGISVTVPSKAESNLDLDYLSDQEKQSLIKTTGIAERRIASDGLTAVDLSIHSAQKLLKSLNWNAEEIGLLVFVTQTPDHTIPGSSMYIQNQLGLPKTCITLDINQGCAGYVFGLSIIGAMMDNTGIDKGLLLVGDTLTKTIAKDDHSLIPIFSDAASCTALERMEGAEPMFFNLQSDGSGYDKIIVKNGGARVPNIDGSFACNLYMNGQDIFNFGLKEVAPNIQILLDEYTIDKSEIDYFVMHQANWLLNETIRKKIGISEDRTLYSLKTYGNTSSASIPVSIADNACKLGFNRNLKILLAGFGVGLSWGSAVVNFNNVKCLEIDEL